MNKNLIKLISLLCVLCMLVAVFASCGGGVTETETESKKETESNETESNETESNETESNETESNETESNETESNETESNETESETESQTETDPETPRETLNLKAETVVNGFVADDWSFDYSEVNMNGSTPPQDEGNPAPFIDANGNIVATGKSRFTAILNELQTLDYGFKLTVKTAINSTVASDCGYWSNSYIIGVGEFAFVMKNAFHEHYNGAAPVVLQIYESFEPVIGFDDYTADGDIVAECYTDVWAHNGSVNDDILAYMNGTWTIDCKDGLVSITNDTFGAIEWELWNGETTSEVELENKEFTDVTVAFYKSWGGVAYGTSNAYYSNFLLEKYVLAE